MSGPRNDEEPGRINLDFKDRTFERRRGCWSCIHWNNGDLSIGKWSVDRQNNLAEALRLSLESPQGEDANPVKNIRRMVDLLDHSIAKGDFGVCLPGFAETDFAHNAYLCDQWTGRVGSSVATEGAPLDLLPEELKDKLDG
jgi:hypothetical protein